MICNYLGRACTGSLGRACTMNVVYYFTKLGWACICWQWESIVVKFVFQGVVHWSLILEIHITKLITILMQRA